MRALLLTSGSHGDIHPFIATARALRQRSAEAAIMTNPWFEREIQAAGIECIAASEPVDVREFMQRNPWMNDVRVAGKRLFGDVLVPALPDVLERLDRELERRRPDVVALNPLWLGAPMLCEARGIPWCSVALAPSNWMSRDEPVCLLPARPWGVHPPLWLWRVLRGLTVPMLRKWIDAGVNRVLAQRGLRPGRDHLLMCMRGSGGGGKSLGMWSPAFRPTVRDDPPGAAICGFPWHDGAAEPPEELARFVQDGPPPIVFSLGTATVHMPGRFYEIAIQSARRLGRRAVLLIGRGNERPANLPADILAAEYAPFSWLLPQAAATVHHGGIGTTAQGLRSGRPMVIVPHAHDQFDNAARAERLGCSATVLRLNERSLERALRQVLEDEQYARRAAAVAPEVSADGAARAAEELIRVASGAAVRR